MNRVWLESHIGANWQIGVCSPHVKTPLSSTLNPLTSHKSNLVLFFPPSQLVLKVTQMEVTRIKMKAMHSKRKPPLARRGSNQGYPSGRTWPESDWQSEGYELWAGFGQMSHRNQKVAQLWWYERTSLMTQTVVQPVSTYFPRCCPALCRCCRLAYYFFSQNESNVTPTQQQGLIHNLGIWMKRGFGFFFWGGGVIFFLFFFYNSE